MAVVDFTEDLVLPAQSERETRVSGFPEGSWLNFISWSDDARHIAFTVRSPGTPRLTPAPAVQLSPVGCTESQAARAATATEQQWQLSGEVV